MPGMENLMRPEEIRRIRKRIDTTLNNFRSIYGCYVNAAGEIVTTMEIPVLDMESEEREMYAAVLNYQQIKWGTAMSTDFSWRSKALS